MNVCWLLPGLKPRATDPTAARQWNRASAATEPRNRTDLSHCSLPLSNRSFIPERFWRSGFWISEVLKSAPPGQKRVFDSLTT